MQKTDYGILGNAIAAFFKSISTAFKGWKMRRYNKKVGKLIEQAEYFRSLTGFRYFVIRFKGRLRVLPKVLLKKWVADGRFKHGITIQDLERMAIYTTKISPKNT